MMRRRCVWVAYETPHPSFTKWRLVKVPGGSTYWATTYPNSDLLFIETGARRRPISDAQGRKLKPLFRAAIERAIAKKESIQ